jgi:bla regulator protein BlaR1
MSALGDHLWQSTLFAVAASLLTLALRKNRASYRYGLWLAASLKFLLPFALLAGMGRQLAWAPDHIAVDTGWYFALVELGRPFKQPVAPGDSALLLRVLGAGIWLCGSGMVLWTWHRRWRTLADAAHHAVPMHEGREAEALRRAQRIAGVKKPIPILLSPASLEPGIFGILSPVLLWPVGISAHFDDAQLEAVLAHEMWHVRRRDNLTAAFHMVVEAAFWFHPLVWWLGARLVHERERACDEKVLELGVGPTIYAESILKTCRFCAGFRLACVSGITGADLKRRITAIMASGAARDLNFGGKLLLATAGLAIIALPTVAGSLDAALARGPDQMRNPDGSSSVLAALHANSNTPAGTTLLQLLEAGSMTGAVCPNSDSGR